MSELARRLGMDRPDAWSQLAELERRDWAVRVLDAKGRAMGHDVPAPQRHLDGPVRDPVRFVVQWLTPGDDPREAVGKTEDAARLAAAEAVWPELPESVRAELGERP